MKNILDILNWRYATKKFDSAKKISDEKLEILKETLRLTPSSLGIQPWKFLFVENKELREKLKEHSWNQPQITDASHLIVMCRLEAIDETHVQKWIDRMRAESGRSDEALAGYQQMILNLLVVDGAPRKANQTEYMNKQVYLALGNLLTSAAAMEIDTCAIGGFDADKYDEILGLKAKGLRACVVCPVGYRHAEDAYQNYSKTRFATEDVIETIE